MKSFSLHGRNAVVAGGSRGIERAIALPLAEVGSDVALTYRERAEDAHQVARETEENGRLAVPLQTDVTDPASIDAAANEPRRALGPIWLRINDAGINKLADFDPVTGGVGDAMLAAILKGPFRCAQVFLPLPASNIAAQCVKAAGTALLKRLGTTREVANAVVFLASDASAHIMAQAQALNVNGRLYF